MLLPTYYSTAYTHTHYSPAGTRRPLSYLSPTLVPPHRRSASSSGPCRRTAPRREYRPSPPRPPPLHVRPLTLSPFPLAPSLPDSRSRRSPSLLSCRYPPPIEQGSDEAKKEDDAALNSKLTHIGSLETWWSKGPEEGKTSDAEVAKIVVEA